MLGIQVGLTSSSSDALKCLDSGGGKGNHWETCLNFPIGFCPVAAGVGAAGLSITVTVKQEWDR